LLDRAEFRDECIHWGGVFRYGVNPTLHE
jgi:hypothetical protein